MKWWSIIGVLLWVGCWVTLARSQGDFDDSEFGRRVGGLRWQSRISKKENQQPCVGGILCQQQPPLDLMTLQQHYYIEPAQPTTTTRRPSFQRRKTQRPISSLAKKKEADDPAPSGVRQEQSHYNPYSQLINTNLTKRRPGTASSSTLTRTRSRHNQISSTTEGKDDTNYNQKTTQSSERESGFKPTTPRYNFKPTYSARGSYFRQNTGEQTPAPSSPPIAAALTSSRANRFQTRRNYLRAKQAETGVNEEPIPSSSTLNPSPPRERSRSGGFILRPKPAGQPTQQPSRRSSFRKRNRGGFQGDTETAATTSIETHDVYAPPPSTVARSLNTEVARRRQLFSARTTTTSAPTTSTTSTTSATINEVPASMEVSENAIPEEIPTASPLLQDELMDSASETSQIEIHPEVVIPPYKKPVTIIQLPMFPDPIPQVELPENPVIQSVSPPKESVIVTHPPTLRTSRHPYPNKGNINERLRKNSSPTNKPEDAGSSPSPDVSISAKPKSGQSIFERLASRKAAAQKLLSSKVNGSRAGTGVHEASPSPVHDETPPPTKYPSPAQQSLRKRNPLQKIQKQPVSQDIAEPVAPTPAPGSTNIRSKFPFRRGSTASTTTSPRVNLDPNTAVTEQEKPKRKRRRRKNRTSTTESPIPLNDMGSAGPIDEVDQAIDQNASSNQPQPKTFSLNNSNKLRPPLTFKNPRVSTFPTRAPLMRSKLEVVPYTPHSTESSDTDSVPLTCSENQRYSAFLKKCVTKFVPKNLG